MPTKVFYNLKEEKRKIIIDAAINEFSNYPLEEVQVKRIVESAKIARGSFYQYFEDIEDLFCYIIEEAKKRMVKNHPQTFKVRSDEELIELIKKQAKERLFSQKNADLIKRDFKLLAQIKQSKRGIDLFISKFGIIPPMFNEMKDVPLVAEIIFPTIKITARKFLCNQISAEIANKEIDEKLNIILNGVRK